MNFTITGGKIEGPQKIVIYGPEGVGKSSLAAAFPRTLFTDTEGSTGQLDLQRLPQPTSWTMLMEEAKHVRDNPTICDTYVIDTADWAERLCSEHICSKSKKDGIEDFGYGKGYTYLAEEFGKWLNLLTEVIGRGVNVVVTAHSWIRTFDQPDELGSYDRYEMKLTKKCAPLLKEWADMLLFCNYKTIVFKANEKDTKAKAQGGKKRVMYASHCAAWDAKNRHGLPDEMSMDFRQIAHCIYQRDSSADVAKSTTTATTAPATAPEPEPAPKATCQTAVGAQATMDDMADAEEIQKIPKGLRDLMMRGDVTITLEDVRAVVSQEGYFPYAMQVSQYPEDFVQGCLIGAWDQVCKKIIKNKAPF